MQDPVGVGCFLCQDIIFRRLGQSDSVTKLVMRVLGAV